MKDYPDSRLIVIDTLQKVRTASKDNAYASDYGDVAGGATVAGQSAGKTAVSCTYFTPAPCMRKRMMEFGT